MKNCFLQLILTLGVCCAKGQGALQYDQQVSKPKSLPADIIIFCLNLLANHLFLASHLWVLCKFICLTAFLMVWVARCPSIYGQAH